MSIFKDVDAALSRAETWAEHAQSAARTHLPEGTEVLFKFGNMVEPAPARVLFVIEFGGYIEVGLKNLWTGAMRRVPLGAIEFESLGRHEPVFDSDARACFKAMTEAED